MPQTRCRDSTLSRISIDGVSDAYVMSNPSLERVLFDRNLVGLEFTQACQEASEAFLVSCI